MLPLILDALLCTSGALLLVPVSILAIEIAAAVAVSRAKFTGSAARLRVAILVPAHNEETGIAATLRSITPQLTMGDRLLVVADNCSDATATVAETEGAEVICRTNLERRGKGFALDFGLQHLRSNPPDIVIMVDADCHVTPGAIDELANMCADRRRPIQALYLMRNKENAPLKMRIAEFAWVVKNLVRPDGLEKLGMPCQLMGSGMAFPWSTISAMDLANAHIVEDMKMGLDMARLGVAPVFCAHALVMSLFPSEEDGIKSQRTRWEHGHLSVILSEVPRMLSQALRQRDLALFALALDLCVPPLALLLLVVTAFWSIAAVFCFFTGLLAPLVITSLATAIFGLAVLTAWATHARQIITFTDLLSACLHPIRKIPLYLQFVFSRQSEWVRSKRDKNS